LSTADSAQALKHEFFCLEKSRRIKNGKQILFFWVDYFAFFAIPFFRGCIGESISGWMTIACSIFSFFLKHQIKI